MVSSNKQDKQKTGTGLRPYIRLLAGCW